MNVPENAGFDTPNILDWEYSDVVPEDYGASISQAREVLLERLTAFNQYTNPKTRSGCGWYGLTHAENAMRILEDVDWGSKNQTDPAGRWIDWNENERPAPSKWNGTSIQSNLNIFRNNKWIAGFAYVNAISEAQRAIDNGHLIYTGTNKCDWRKTYDTGVFVPAGRTVTGHLFCIVEYNDDGFIIWESNGPRRGKVLIKYEHIDLLYSRVAVIPISNVDLISKYKTMSQFDKEFQDAIKQGITNGERPQDPAIRKESAVMDVRTLAKAQAYTDEKFIALEAKIDVLMKSVEALTKRLENK